MSARRGPCPVCGQVHGQRGLCQVCGTVHTVRADGTLRSHWQTGTSHRCMGSGWAPLGATDEAVRR